MKLQILIPQYDETEEVIKPLLDSIAIQQNVSMDEIGVIICNDGSDVILSDTFLNNYPYKIEYYKMPHRGVSAARNTCLDKAVADYVIFCDADDMFYNVCAFWILFREIDENGGFDSLVSVFIEESRRPDTKKVEYVAHNMDSTFVHGKVHKLEYLKKFNIRFNDNLTIHEDSYFNILCQSLSTNVKYCPTPFYLWRWRDNSVCRHDKKYILKTYNNMLDSNEALVTELRQRGKEDKALLYTVMIIFDSYYLMNMPEWLDQENQEYRNSTEKRFSSYFKKNKKAWEEIPFTEKMAISNSVRSRHIQEGMRMEAVTIDDWLKHIENL